MSSGTAGSFAGLTQEGLKIRWIVLKSNYCPCVQGFDEILQLLKIKLLYHMTQISEIVVA